MENNKPLPLSPPTKAQAFNRSGAFVCCGDVRHPSVSAYVHIFTKGYIDSKL